MPPDPCFAWYLSKLPCSLKPTEVLVACPTAIVLLFVVWLISSSCDITISCQCHQTTIKFGFGSCFPATTHALSGKVSDSMLWSFSNTLYVLSLDLLHLTGHIFRVFVPSSRAWGGRMEMTGVAPRVRKEEEKLYVVHQRLLSCMFPHFPATGQHSWEQSASLNAASRSWVVLRFQAVFAVSAHKPFCVISCSVLFWDTSRDDTSCLPKSLCVQHVISSPQTCTLIDISRENSPGMVGKSILWLNAQHASTQESQVLIGFTLSNCFSNLSKEKPFTVKYSYDLSGEMLLLYAYLRLISSIENGKKMFKIHKWLALIPLSLLQNVEHQDSKFHWTFFKICIGCFWVFVRRTTQAKVYNNAGGKSVYLKKKKKKKVKRNLTSSA